MKYRYLRLRWKAACAIRYFWQRVERASVVLWNYSEEKAYQASRRESSEFRKLWTEVSAGEMDNVLPFEGRQGREIPIDAA